MWTTLQDRVPCQRFSVPKPSIWVSVDSDPAHGVSRLPEFRALHHRHSPVEIMRAAAYGVGRSLVDAIEVKPGAFGVKIDLKAVSRR
jgi:hypothetical protein